VVARVHYPAADLRHLLSTVVVIALDIHHDAGNFGFNDPCMWPRLPRHLVCVKIRRSQRFSLDFLPRNKKFGPSIFRDNRGCVRHVDNEF
jgi:hypothetical protein